MFFPGWVHEFFSHKPKLSEALTDACVSARSISPPPQSYVDADRAFHAKMASLEAANTARENLQNVRKRMKRVDSQMLEALGGGE